MKRLPSFFRLPQEKLLALGIDLSNGTLLSYIRFWCERRKSKQIEFDGEMYTRFHYPTILRDLPILGIHNKNALTPRIKKLHDIGVIEVHRKANNALYIRLTEKGYNVFDNAHDNGNDNDQVTRGFEGPYKRLRRGLESASEGLSNAGSMQGACETDARCMQKASETHKTSDNITDSPESPRIPPNPPDTSTVHETETVLSNGHEQLFVEPRHDCPMEPSQNKEVNKKVICNKERKKSFDKEPEKDFSASADASALSLSKTKNEKDSAREKEDVGVNGDEPSQKRGSFDTPNADKDNDYGNRSPEISIHRAAANEYFHSLSRDEQRKFDRRALELWDRGKGEPGLEDKRNLRVARYLIMRATSGEGASC